MEIKSEHFDPKAIADSGQCFRWKRFDTGEFEIPAFDRCLRIRPCGDRLILSCTEDEYQSVWRAYFDMDTDYGALDRRGDSFGDRYLSAAVSEEPGIRILRQNFWEALVSFIISQNNNIPRIRKSIDRLCGGGIHFPLPEEILSMDLSQMGLGYRDEYLKSAARWQLSGNNDISEIRGVGPKVLSCVRLYGMHKMDECPMDTWMKRLLHEVYEDRVPDWVSDPAAGYYQQLCFMKIRRDTKKPNGTA